MEVKMVTMEHYILKLLVSNPILKHDGQTTYSEHESTTPLHVDYYTIGSVASLSTHSGERGNRSNPKLGEL